MEFPIPQHLAKRDNDYISYTAIDAKGASTEVNNICYASHMSMLSTHEIICLPRRDKADWKGFFIDYETYLRFVEILKKNKIITEGTTAYIEKDVPMMKVPMGTSRHRAYAALCAYRWAESCSPLAWLTVKLYEDIPEVSLWQVLHFVMAQFVSGIGHNWCNIGITDFNYGHAYFNTGQSFNMALSLAFPLFWYKSEEEMLAINTQRTCEALQAISNNIGPTVTGAAKMPVPTLLVNGKQTQCDVLNSRWSPLYKLAGVAAASKWESKYTKEELGSLYAKIVAEHKDIQELRDKVENPKKNSPLSGARGYYDDV